MIIIDGRQTNLRIENFANLEEILVEANSQCTEEKRIVTDVLLNNEQFTEIYPHQAEDIERAEIRSVEIRSVPLGEMALNISDELFKVTRMMCDGSARIAALFRQGDDQEALELFQDLLDVTRDFMSTVGVLRSEFVEVSDPQFSVLVERVSELLGEMGDVLNSEDWILLADLLEFEFKPVCEAWNKNLETLRADIARSLD
ncbi:MAG: hypothetical protein J1E80_08930 [Desulfovibrionaceae bacterium]|nr:hypothetical protein [Desulfovibrionaceae bacterium]